MLEERLPRQPSSETALSRHRVFAGAVYAHGTGNQCCFFARPTLDKTKTLKQCQCSVGLLSSLNITVP